MALFPTRLKARGIKCVNAKTEILRHINLFKQLKDIRNDEMATMLERANSQESYGALDQGCQDGILQLLGVVLKSSLHGMP
eukprot:2241477-Amphidinium_carterae.1